MNKCLGYNDAALHATNSKFSKSAVSHSRAIITQYLTFICLRVPRVAALCGAASL